MRYSQFIFCTLLAMTLGQPLAAQPDDIASHPGFVDFSELDEIAGQEPSVEISLKEPLLNIVTSVMRNNDEQVADFISTLSRVTVRVFDSSGIDTARMSETMSAIAQRLDTDRWDRVIRVREGSEHVDVYFKLSANADLIQGIAIMVTEPGETVLVNIVGDISPSDISAIGARFDIDELSDMDYDPATADNN